MKEKICVRSYRSDDCVQVGQLFVDTVYAINSRDYGEKEIQAWADPLGIARVGKSLEKNFAYVAELNGAIVGFGDMTSGGLIDHLYVHRDYQRRGIASRILDALETKARALHLSEIHTESSITAKPFFEAQGFYVKAEQVKVTRGASFTTYLMIKRL